MLVFSYQQTFSGKDICSPKKKGLTRTNSAQIKSVFPSGKFSGQEKGNIAYCHYKKPALFLCQHDEISKLKGVFVKPSGNLIVVVYLLS